MSRAWPWVLVLLTSLVLWSCGEVTALPPLPAQEGRSGLLVQAGSESAVFAFALGPGQPAPTRAPFTADAVPSFAWLVFSCPLSELALSPGRQRLNAQASERLFLPDPARSYVLSGEVWAEAATDAVFQAVLRRLPLDAQSFCPGSIRGVEVEDRLLVGGDREDEVDFARILPVGRKALILRGLGQTETRNVEVWVQGSTTTITERVRRIVAGRIHELDLDEALGASTTLRLDSDSLPFLEGTRDEAGVTLWGPGRRARFRAPLGAPTFSEEPLLEDAETLQGLAWSQGQDPLALLVMDDQPEPADAPEDVRGEARLRRLRLLGDVDGVLRALAELELPYESPNPVRLWRLEDGRILVRGWGAEDLLVRTVDGDFELTPRANPEGELRRIEGQTFLLAASGSSFVYESGLFVRLPERPTWPFLATVERQLTLDGRALFNEGGIIAERVDGASVCPVADLGRPRWDAVSRWADRWAFLEPGDGRGAGLFLVRPQETLPACGPRAEGD